MPDTSQLEHGLNMACSVAWLLCRGVRPAGAGGQGEAGVASEGSTAGELSLEILAQLPLRDLLNLYALLCTWLADTFPAGPAELGPAFEVRLGLPVVPEQPSAAA